MAGYSGTPLPKKLGIKPAARLATINAPPDFGKTLGELPPDVTAQPMKRGPYDVIVLFAQRQTELARGLPAARDNLDVAGGLWVAWLKKTAGIPTDVTESEVRRQGLAAGLVDNKVCAIDESWSGLRFVRRLTDRPAARKKQKI